MFLSKWALFRNSPNGVDGGGSPTPTDEDKVEKTKAFAKRLSEKTQKVDAASRADERERIAKENGFASYEAFQIAIRDTKIKTETQFDPTDADFAKLAEIIKNTSKTDPKYDELQARVDAYEQEKATQWEQEQVRLLKETYGVDVKELSALDKPVLDKIAKGIDPIDAYYLVHKPTVVVKPTEDTKGKEHLKGDPTNSTAGGNKDVVTPTELERFREFSPDLTDEQIKERIKKIRENK